MRQKLLLLSLSILLLSLVPSEAATYSVKSGGGGDYTTIQACANAAVAGDTCVVYAGTYDETPSLKTSGSPGSPITFAVNSGDCVTVTGFNLRSSSYVTLGTFNSQRCTKGGFSYSGFEVTGGQITWTRINNVIIQYNYVHNTSGICLRGPGSSSSGASSYVYFLNNIITLCGTIGEGLQGGMQIEGDHWLIDGNTLSHVEDGIYLYGAYMVVRNNTFGPLLPADYTTQHPDAIESTCTFGKDFPLQHMLYENNTTINWGGSDAHGFLLRDTQSCGQTSNVIRFSQFIDLGSYWIANESNSTSELIYNNSVENTQASAKSKDLSDLVFTKGDTGANVINNAIANSGRPGSNDYCIFVDGPSEAGFVENHNLCFLTGWSGTWQKPYSGYTYSETDIFNKDPLFVNSSSDLHLQIKSPNIGKGGPLTSAIGSGANSTSLVVANAGFFCDGYGLTGVQADRIRIGGSTTVQISSVNYSTNVLTLANPVSWSSGAPIYLYKNSDGTVVLNGANPDIGAFPFGSTGESQAPLPATNVQAVAK
jgi:hypothetical protein